MSWYSLLSFFSFLVCAYSGIYVLRLNYNSGINRVFFYLAFFVAIWNFAYTFIYTEKDLGKIEIWYKITAVGWATFVSFTIHFLLYLTGKKKLLKKHYTYIILYVPAILFLIKALSGGFIASGFEIRDGLVFEIQDMNSYWYIAYILYYWAFMIFGVISLKLFANKTKFKKEKIQANIIFYTVIILVITSTITNVVFPMLDIRTVPAIAQILITSWMFAIWYSIVKYKLMTLTAETAAKEIITEMKELLFFVDNNNNVIRINKFTEKTLGFSADKIINRDFASFFNESTEAVYALNSVFENSQVVSVDFNLKTNHDKVIPVNLTFSHMRDRYGDPIGTIVVGRDIRETLQLQEEIRQRKDAQEKINIQKSEIESQAKQLEIKNFELRKINLQITDSINYARHIQASILPDDLELKKHFADSFIIFMPRDIVSGDFYWIAEENNYVFIAVVDCTGHGVPGAFMSIIGHTLLNEIIIEKQISEPSEILQQLNIGVNKTLNYERIQQKIVQDGMEISLCRIDKNSRTILFAGTNQTIILISQNTARLFSGDIYSIGSALNRENTSYCSKQINYNQGDCLYLFTDGYPDQLSGINNKKLGLNKLEQIIIENNNKAFSEQKSVLESNLMNWKNDRKQTDDITVVGVKL